MPTSRQTGTVEEFIDLNGVSLENTEARNGKKAVQRGKLSQSGMQEIQTGVDSKGFR